MGYGLVLGLQLAFGCPYWSTSMDTCNQVWVRHPAYTQTEGENRYGYPYLKP